MAVHKLHIEDFDEIDYQLIAIHTTLEDYRLAYFLNQNLPILLYRTTDDIQISTRDGIANFSRYTFTNQSEDSVWDLIANHGEILTIHHNSVDLFANATLEIPTRIFLVPEYKKASFFIKIENAAQPVQEILTIMNNIERITTVYSVDSSKIKSKNNLIF